MSFGTVSANGSKNTKSEFPIIHCYLDYLLITHLIAFTTNMTPIAFRHVLSQSTPYFTSRTASKLLAQYGLHGHFPSSAFVDRSFLVSRAAVSLMLALTAMLLKAPNYFKSSSRVICRMY